LADAHLGGEMNHTVHALQGARHSLLVAHVAADQFHLGIEHL
jgi:hypothetical protein